MIQFNDTKIAFAWRSNSELVKAKVLFKTIAWPALVKVGSAMLNIALAIRFPISWIVKPTIFKHFVGGENLAESNKTAQRLLQYNVNSVLDYSVEGADDEAIQEEAFNEILRSVQNAKNNVSIAFTVFKPTGLISTKILEKVSNSQELSQHETAQFDLFKQRVKTLCEHSVSSNTPILVDAEDSWYQKAIDDVVTHMMKEFNKEKVFVYNTLQMYRTDRLDFLKAAHKDALAKGYLLGVKFVRGAYMEKERARAQRFGYPSPIHPNKEETDKAFDDTQQYAFE
ncbi:MAG TPA: proline dehydrogenase family protein, partial [Tenuifilaceae bacterium]|nr:proline dehydrogenase family protein [Tenuifilaceae bacterium]